MQVAATGERVVDEGVAAELLCAHLALCLHNIRHGRLLLAAHRLYVCPHPAPLRFSLLRHRPTALICYSTALP